MAACPAAESGVVPWSGGPPGSARFDPVRRRYLDAMARRSELLAGPAKALLEQRLALAQARYASDFDKARTTAATALAELQARFPDAAEPLRQHWCAGDFAAMRQLGQRLGSADPAGPLIALIHHIDRLPADADRSARAPAPAELKAVRNARDTWTRLRVDRQMARSLARLPDNPGPLNSHRLILRCLQRLQAISPHYLSRLLSQLDTWVWLEQASAAPPREGRPKR